MKHGRLKMPKKRVNCDARTSRALRERYPADFLYNFYLTGDRNGTYS